MQKNENIFAEFNSIEWRTYDTFGALKSFHDYWKETERLLAAAADESEKQDHGFEPGTGDPAEDYYQKKKVARHLHDEVATPALRYSAVISLFAVIERELKRSADNLAKEKQNPVGYRDLKGGLFDQIDRYTEAYCGFRFKELDGFPELRMLQRVRNCIVHAYGEPDMMSSSDRDFLIKLDSSSRGIEAHSGMELILHPPFIEQAVAAAKRLFLALFLKAGWKVNDRWLPPGGASQQSAGGSQP